MIKLEKTEYGVVPCGPGQGNIGIGLYFKDDGKEYAEDADYEKIVSKDVKKIKTDLEKIKVGLYENALKSKIQLIFIGNGLEKPSNKGYNDELFRQFDHESLELQKNDKNLLSKMRPPFYVWVGSPLEYTGQRLFYEQFNICVALCPTNSKKEVTQENLGELYSPMALVEIANHHFSTFVFNVSYQKELEVIKLYLANSIPVNGDRITIIPNTFDIIENCEAFAKENNLRLGVNYNLTFKNALVFWR